MKNNKGKVRVSLLSRIILLIVFLFVLGMGLLSLASYSSGVKTTNELAVAEMRRTASLIATTHSLFEKPDWELTRDFVEMILSLYIDGDESDFIELFYIFIKDDSDILRVNAVNYDIARKYGIKIIDDIGEPLSEESFDRSDMTAPYDKEIVPHLDRVVMPAVVNGRKRCTVEVGYLVTGLATKEKYSLIQTLIIFTFLSVAGGIIAVVMIRWNMLPIINTVEAMKDVARGRFDVEVPESDRAETRLLTLGFNTMIGEIRRNNLEIKQKSEEVEASVMKYRSLFQLAGDCIMLVDENGICVDANFAAERLFKKPVRQLLNCYVLELVRPLSGAFDFHKLPTRWEGAVDIAGNVGTEVEAHTAGLDDNTRIVIFHNITSRKKAERRVNMVRQIFLNHFEDFPVGILIVDSGFDLIFANRLVRDIFNGETDMLTVTWAEFKSRFFNIDIETAVADVLSKKQDMILKEVSIEKSDRGRLEADIQINLFTDDPDTPAQAMLVINITQK